MDLRRSDQEGLNRLGELWTKTPGAEFEAALTGMDLTAWQDVIQYLRSLGMRENPQLVKLNICLSNDIRITLEGAGVVQAYCRDNRLGNKPFTAMLKENIEGAEPVQLGSYAVKGKLKRELPLAADDERVKEVIGRWDQLGKHFRMIQRFEFVAPGGVPIRFDLSMVRENASGRPARTFQEARVTSAPARYEAEIELTAKREGMAADLAVRNVLRGISWLLQGRQRSYVLVSNAGADAVRDAVSGIFGLGGASAAGGGRNRGSNSGNRNRTGPSPFRFPGPQPATLERRHIAVDADPGSPNVRTMPGGYNVTDKADGLRCLLFVNEAGRVFLIDGGGRVYATGKETDKSLGGTVLDGEWIRKDKTGKGTSHYYAFDILAARGDPSIAAQPFMIAGEMLGSAATANTRQAAMSAAVSALATAKQVVRGVPAAQDLQVGMKTFRTAAGVDLFRDAAAATLSSAKSAPYNTDGLIFTPNAAPLPIGRGTWHEQLKWKPPHENTIDFLVIVDRERDKSGKPTGVDAIGSKYRDDAGHTVRYKTLRLFVGSNRDVAFADPRRTVLAGEALPASLDEGEWREVEFRPTDPRDPMAAICYVAIGEGAADPAAATQAATALDTDSDAIRCTRSGDIIQSDMIIEMAYHPERAPGWRWEPVRVRHDKTERWLAQQAGVGRKGGTMNADWVANSIWNSIHNPVTADMIQTGTIVHCAAPDAIVAPMGYSMRRAPARDLMKVQCLRNFHDFIKRSLLYRKTLTPGATICDLAMGRGEDISKWISIPVGFAFGCDVVGPALNDPVDGAYRKLLDKMVALGGRDRVPRMAFAQADAARNLRTGEAGATGEDQEVLRMVFDPAGGPGSGGFDVVSCMFALHYMCRDQNTLAGFLMNVADNLKVGGYFIGCGLDGDAIARAVMKGNAVGQDGETEAWSMTKRYGSGVGSSVPPSAAGLGLAVDVDFISQGESHTEYLMSWPYIQTQLATVGLELLTPEECAALGLPASTQMFNETWDAAAAAGETYAMSDAMRRLSFMNRWWVLKRRADLRPVPPMETPAAPSALTEQMPFVSEAHAGIKPSAEAIMGMPAPEDVIPLPEAPAMSKEFVVNAANHTPDMRIGAALADWPRYMSLGTLVELTDMHNPSVKYPSVEAAIASAKYQLATDKAEIGPQIFRVEGAVHAKWDKEREKIMATMPSGDERERAMEKSVDDQVAMTRVASGANKMKAYKATYDRAAWDAQKEGAYRAYLRQRFEKDERFREMVLAIREAGGQILFANGTEPSELGVGIRLDGSVAGGENKVGNWMMELA